MTIQQRRRLSRAAMFASSWIASLFISITSLNPYIVSLLHFKNSIQLMQQGLCHRRRSPASTTGCGGGAKSLVEENAVVVFAQRGCCMSYVVRRLLHAVGANPAVYEVEERDVDGLAHELAMEATTGPAPRMQFPAVFIGGRWFGGPDRVIATHITEELSPLLKQAGALWL